DYLLKPIRREQLARALTKLERMCALPVVENDLSGAELARRLAGALAQERNQRIPSRLGDRVVFVELAQVSHFVAESKLTLAVAPNGKWVVDETIGELEARLAPDFFRIHRATLVRVARIRELFGRAEAAVFVRLDDAGGTELAVARDRVRAL